MESHALHSDWTNYPPRLFLVAGGRYNRLRGYGVVPSGRYVSNGRNNFTN
jgi:hypothetical protein